MARTVKAEDGVSTRNDVLNLLEIHRGESLSGGDIARQLSVSRNAVWKAVRELQKEGHQIEGVTNKGYCLSSESDVISREGIRLYLSNPDRIGGIQVFKTVDSTNNLAKQMAMAGAPHGTVIIAEAQSSGRGRKGRAFISPAGGGLYTSFLFRPALDVNQALITTAAAAVLTARTLESVKDCDITIKWVNDVFLQNKKVCGILTEAATDWESGAIDYLIIGIGINVKPSGSGFPPEVDRVAGNLFGPGETAVLRNRLAALLIDKIFDFFQELEENPKQAAKSIMAEYRQRSNVLNHRIQILGDPSLTEGLAVDIDDQGFLIVEDDQGGRHTLNSGEVSILPDWYQR